MAQNSAMVSEHSLAANVSLSNITDRYFEINSKKFLAGGLTYSFSSYNRYHKKELLVSWDKGSSTGSKDQLTMNNIHLQYSNGFSLVRNKKSWFNYYVGYSVLTNPQLIKSSSEYSWATINALSLYNSLAGSFNKTTVSLDITVPLAGLASRPVTDEVDNGNFNEMMYNSYSGLFFTSVHNLKAVDASLHFEQQFTVRLRLHASLSYCYKELKSDYLFREANYKGSAGLTYRLL
jgi:hypothetical protein